MIDFDSPLEKRTLEVVDPNDNSLMFVDPNLDHIELLKQKHKEGLETDS